MADRKCTYSVREGVAVMTVDNPPVNALSKAVVEDIETTVNEALRDETVRVIVFTGAGKRAFIAGADINELVNLGKKEDGIKYLTKGQELTKTIENSDKPFIAAIQGYCLGGGMEFALSCHIRIADEKAKFGQPEIKLGVIPGYGGTQRGARQMGKARALELILAGDFISAKQAAEYGVVNRVVPEGEVLDAAMSLAQAIAKKSRVVVKATIRAINEGVKLDFDASMKLEKEIWGELCETEDKAEGVAAFLEKREPKFKDK